MPLAPPPLLSARVRILVKLAYLSISPSGAANSVNGGNVLSRRLLSLLTGKGNALYGCHQGLAEALLTAFSLSSTNVFVPIPTLWRTFVQQSCGICGLKRQWPPGSIGRQLLHCVWLLTSRL